jgi:hypothetical protein
MHTDDTGWRVAGKAAFMIAFVNQSLSVYQVRRLARNQCPQRLVSSAHGSFALLHRILCDRALRQMDAGQFLNDGGCSCTPARHAGSAERGPSPGRSPHSMGGCSLPTGRDIGVLATYFLTAFPAIPHLYCVTPDFWPRLSRNICDRYHFPL